MKRKIAMLLSGLLTASALTGCGESTPRETEQSFTHRYDSYDEKQTETSSSGDFTGDNHAQSVSQMTFSEGDQTAITDFAVRLFKESLTKEENTLISPLSVLVALSMTANGAQGNTLAQMEDVLGMPVRELNTWVCHYMSNLPEKEEYKLRLANSIWFKHRENLDSFEVKQEFLQTNADFYGAGIYKAPFDESTCGKINQWVEDNTDGMIKDILDRIPEDAVMYLINALAFDAEWENVYKKNNIKDGEFTKEDGTKQNAELMYSEENRYLEDDKAVGFIKYYKDQKYAFAALLPNEGIPISEYAASLTGEKVSKLLSGASTAHVQAAIPKFETEYKLNLNQALITMGMSDAFNSTAADFSGISENAMGNLYINRVIHQTFISVDEKGTKAGAATVVEVNRECAIVSPTDTKEVILDRPFVYMLIDCETNLPFFIGTMMEIER